MIKRIFFLSICSTVFLALAPHAHCIQPAVGDIVDTRTSGKLAGRLEVELKVLGDEVPDIHGMRASIIGAVDGTGRDLTDLSRSDKLSQRYVSVGNGEKSLRLMLKSPSRRAAVIKELIGRLDLFMPRNDPESIVLVEDLLTKTGKPLDVISLKNAGIEITPMTRGQFEAARDTKSGPALGNLVGISNLDDNSIVLSTVDSEGRVVSIEFQTEAGERIRPHSSMAAGNARAFYFAEQLPPKARLRIEVATLKSVVRVPFSFENVLLP